ncbi:MAG: hypothetical protein JNK49_11815 [Planctomycetes bacterium]|nr:hypothetical protein [Planctomycetota bacterium]
MSQGGIQLEVPQISLRRYFDLLKRRRWRVIPVSLLGLLVGGIIAFFIPRYYVADAVVTYQTPLADTVAAANEDPFAAEVDAAKITIPLAIGATVKQLGWPEGAVVDRYELGQNLRVIEGRLRIDDSNPGKGRTFARLQVTFRDRDGLRAAAFVNALVETWKKQRTEAVRTAAEAARASATQRYTELQQQCEGYLQRRTQLAQAHGIDPLVDITAQTASFNARLQAQQKRADELSALRIAVQGQELELATLEEQRQATPPRAAPDAAADADTLAKVPGAKELTALVEAEKLKLQVHKPGTRLHQLATDELARLQERLQKVMAAAGGAPGAEGPDADGLVASPKYRDLVAKQEQLRLDLEKNRAAVALLTKEVAAEAERFERLAAGHQEYAKLGQALDDATKTREAAWKRLEDANARLVRLQNQPPIRTETRADPPPRPTEPNILLVALLGCALGLGAAIALILLFDMLQGTFKTLDDVERAIPVPVLGGISHLETAEERAAAQQQRTRVGLVTAAFVVLLVGVVVVFYWDPTRLPVFVRDLLAMVLGAT